MTALPTKILISVLLISVSWAGGYFSGLNAGRAAQLADTVAAYQKRDSIDAEVSTFDDQRLCVALGGLPEQCEQLRRLETPTDGQ